MFESEGRHEPFSMPAQRDTHKGGSGKSRYKTKRLFEPAFLTSDSYQDSLVFDMRMFARVLVHLKEVGGSNAIKYNILACLDPSMWKAIKTDQALTAGSEATEAITEAWNWVKLQVASNVAGNAGKVNAFATGKTP
jgi:hypothetical protein